MKTALKTMLAVYMLLVISCKKENTAIQSSGSTDESATDAFLTDMNEPAAIEVTIGTQVWMKRNWSGVRYRNGDRIPQVTDAAEWRNLTTGAWCWNDNNTANGKTYGKLYNWYAVNDPRGLAPEGWHVPSDAELTTLTTFLGGEDVAGGKLKSTGTKEDGTGLWVAPNTDATNSSGFTMLPGGSRTEFAIFIPVSNFGYLWSSTEFSAFKAWNRNLTSLSAGVFRVNNSKRAGFSVRFIKD